MLRKLRIRQNEWFSYWKSVCVCVGRGGGRGGVSEGLLNPLFINHYPLLHPTSWSNMLTSKFSKQVFIFALYLLLNHFRSLLSFYTPSKHQKPFGFLVFSRGTEWLHWLEMGWFKQVPNSCYVIIDFLI